MFKARTADGHNNISGLRVKELRKALQISQRELSDRLQVVGLDIDKNAVQRQFNDTCIIRNNIPSQAITASIT